MKTLMLSTLTLFLFMTPVWTDEDIENLCHDPAALAQWEEMNEKHPDDLNIQNLHALRIGLCEKIDRGDIGVADGIAIFEAMRSATVNRAFQRRLQEHNDLDL